MADTADLDALVIRNIGDIEAALIHARELETGLLEAVESILVDELGPTWHVEYDPDDDYPLWLTHSDWIEEGTPARKNSYRLQMEEKDGPDGVTEGTWLSTFLRTGPHGARAIIYFWANSFNTNKRWAKITEGQSDRLQRLAAAGFETDSRGRLYIPFSLDMEELAKGYETGDLESALHRARELGAIIRTSAADLDALVERDRNLD